MFLWGEHIYRRSTLSVHNVESHHPYIMTYFLLSTFLTTPTTLDNSVSKSVVTIAVVYLSI